MKYRRPRQAKWDKRHLVTVSTHLTEEQYQNLRALCVLNHDKPYFIVRRALLTYIDQKGGGSDLDLLRSMTMEEEKPRAIEALPDTEQSYSPLGVIIRH